MMYVFTTAIPAGSSSLREIWSDIKEEKEVERRDKENFYESLKILAREKCTINEDMQNAK